MAEFGDRLKQARQKKVGIRNSSKGNRSHPSLYLTIRKGCSLAATENHGAISGILGVTKDFLAGDEGAFERKILMRNIDSLSPESIAKINAIAEMMKEAERAKKRGTNEVGSRNLRRAAQARTELGLDENSPVGDLPFDKGCRV